MILNKNKSMKLKTTYYIDILKRFDTHIISTKSIKTGNHYTGEVEEFLKFLEENEINSLKKANAQVMKDYYSYLITRPKKRGTGTLSISSINANLSTLRMLSKRMQNDDTISRGLEVPNNIRVERDEDNPFTLIRQILTTDEVLEVFENCKNNLEKALIGLAYGCGLRRSSLANLQEKKINYSSGTVTVKAKFGQIRTIPISNFFVEVIRIYNRERLQILSSFNSREQRFFIDKNGRAVSGQRLNEMLKQIIKRTQNQTIIDKKITLHCLRHSIATHLLDAGQTFEFVKEFLGHSFVDTTTIYARRRKIKNYYIT